MRPSCRRRGGRLSSRDAVKVVGGAPGAWNSAFRCPCIVRLRRPWPLRGTRPPFLASSLTGDPDPFRVLSVSYEASLEDVRGAFRRLARETHPDRGGSADAFHVVREAFGVLSADLEGERRRWATPPSRPRVRYAAGLDPTVYPTCTVRVEKGRDGRSVTTYVVEGRPSSWRPGRVPPPGGECKGSYAATDSAPAFGVWVVSVDAERFRCVFGPYPPGG
jgi:hypothetical protein